MPNVSVEIEGKEYHGTYTVTGDLPLVRVVSSYGSHATQQGGLPPEHLAQVLLCELVERQQRR